MHPEQIADEKTSINKAQTYFLKLIFGYIKGTHIRLLARIFIKKQGYGNLKHIRMIMNIKPMKDEAVALKSLDLT